MPPQAPKQSRIALALILALSGCGGGGSKSSSPVVTPPATVQEALARAGKLPAPGERDATVSTDTATRGDFSYATERHDAVVGLTDLAYLGQADALLWPGALLNGGQLAALDLGPVTVGRGPLTLAVYPEGTSGAHQSAVVTDPSAATIGAKVAQLLGGILGTGVHGQARVVHADPVQVTSSSHLGRAVGFNVAKGNGDLGGKFAWAGPTRANKIFMKLTHRYYTVEVSPPASGPAFLASGLTAADAASAMPAGSMPLYVSSVTYGMLAAVCVESDFTGAEVSAALAALIAGTPDAAIHFGYTAAQVLRSSNITVVLYGARTLAAVQTGYDGLLAVLQADRQYGPDLPAVPIEYRVSNLLDGTLAVPGMAVQYGLVTARQVQQQVTVRIETYTCLMSDDEGVANDVDIDRLRAWVTRYQGTPLVASPSGPQLVYTWDGGPITTPVGYVFTIGQELTVALDGAAGDLEAASRLDLMVYVRDYDSASANEEAQPVLQVPGASYFAAGGVHEVDAVSSDFDYRARFVLRDASRPWVAP